LKQSQPCTETDLIVLRDELKYQYHSHMVGAIVVLIIAFVFPWLGSSKTHGKAMVNYMPYPEAIASILFVGGLIMAAAWFLYVPKIKKDLEERIKIVYQTQVKDKEWFRRRSARGWFIYPAEMPFSPGKKIYVTKNEYDNVNVGDEIEISFFPNSKKIIKVIKVL
jgi:hypothetical protein